MDAESTKKCTVNHGAAVRAVAELGTQVSHFIQDSQNPTTSRYKGLDGADTLVKIVRFKSRASRALEDLCKESPDTIDLALELRTACEVIAGDILLRLDSASSTQAGSNDEIILKAWSQESLIALRDQVSWIQRQLPSSEEGNEPSASRSLWTEGPRHQYQTQTTNEASESGGTKLPATGNGNDINNKVEIKGTLLNEDKAELIQDFLVESLAFPAMNDREEEVSKAHYQTFEWIYSSGSGEEPASETEHTFPKLKFAPWLRGDDLGQLFWVNGKAGSGKSTLFRFITDHKQSANLLQQWASGSELFMVSFFFWTGGSLLQRSQVGLLRSLLHQILTQRPNLIPWVFPEIWLSCQDTKRRVQIMLNWQWELPQLLSGLRLALQLATKTAKVCLFIDGLDEFDGGEEVVIGFVRSMIEIASSVKVCVSSRPWSAFLKAFTSVPQLLLQDLTKGDMERYINDRLRNDAKTGPLMGIINQNDLTLLLDGILKQANGVFLWASLAMRFTLRSISSKEDITTLHRKFVELPSDLEDLFRHLLYHSRTQQALREQSNILQIIRARDEVCDFTGDDSVRSISLYQMLLAFEGDIKYTESPITQCDQEKTSARCASFANALEELCAGLIVLSGQDKTYARTHTRSQSTTSSLHSSATRRVHYVHRTVRDFLAYPEAWKEILEHAQPSNFDAHINLIQSHILRLRSPLDQPEQHRRLDEWWHDDIVPALTHARFASPSTAHIQMTLLDSLDATLSWYWRKRNKFDDDPLDTWARHAFGSYEERNKHKTPFHHAFLSLAAKFGCTEYLRLKLASSKNFHFQAGIPLLSHALEFLVSRRKTVYPLSSQSLLEVLLSHGEDPNQKYKDMMAQSVTPWLLALKYIREGQRRGWIVPFDIDVQGTRRWAGILKVMLGYGSDKRAVILKDELDPETNAVEVVDTVVDAYFSRDVWNVKRMLEDRKC